MWSVWADSVSFASQYWICPWVCMIVYWGSSGGAFRCTMVRMAGSPNAALTVPRVTVPFSTAHPSPDEQVYLVPSSSSKWPPIVQGDRRDPAGR